MESLRVAVHEGSRPGRLNMWKVESGWVQGNYSLGGGGGRGEGDNQLQVESLRYRMEVVV